MNYMMKIKERYARNRRFIRYRVLDVLDRISPVEGMARYEEAVLYDLALFLTRYPIGKKIPRERIAKDLGASTKVVSEALDFIWYAQRYVPPIKFIKDEKTGELKVGSDLPLVDLPEFIRKLEKKEKDRKS